MKKSELKSFIREEIISTLSEDLDELEDQLDVVDQKLDAVISKKEEAGVNEQVDKFNVDVFGYKTKYYKVCPGAKAFMDKVMDGAYGDMSQKQNEVIRIAKLHDLLFIRELKALKDSNYADQVIPQVEYIAEEIKDNVQLLGIPVADVDYVDNHVEIIKDAAKKKDQIATDDMLEEGDLFSSKFDRQELKAIINDLNKDLILDMPTRRAYKFLVSLLDKEDKEELGLSENGHVEEYTDEIAEADIDVDLVRATAAKANNQITNAAGMADFILDVINQIGEKEQEGILNNINLKQAINFLEKAKESAGVKKVDESHAMGGVEAELEAGEIGNMDALTEEIAPTGIGISGDQLKDLIKLGAIAGVEVYVRDKDGKNVRTVDYTLTNTDFEKDPEMIDLDYIDENEGQEALKEHFNRFMFKKYS